MRGMMPWNPAVPPEETLGPSAACPAPAAPARLVTTGISLHPAEPTRGSLGTSTSLRLLGSTVISSAQPLDVSEPCVPTGASGGPETSQGTVSVEPHFLSPYLMPTHPEVPREWRTLGTRASGCIGGWGAPPSKAELKRTLKELVDEAVARQAAELATGSAAGALDPLHVTFSAATELPGAPCPPLTQKIRGLKGAREVGHIHDAVVMDPTIPRAAWVTRCAWKFGLGPHILKEGAETTCSRCISNRVVEARSVLSG